MLDRVIPTVTVVAAVGSGLVGGLLFTFSAFLMTVLSRLPPAQGIAAMQSINVAILNPLFGLLFVVGVFGLTMVANVPLNNELAAVDPASVDGAQLWERYVARWTAWNHVRTLAAIAAATILTVVMSS